MKISRPEYGLEQQIIEAIYALREKKSSIIFREPVDSSRFPDYYYKIQKPIDLTTIVNKLKAGEYQFISQVLDDINLIITNCRKYNTAADQVLKTADQFQDCIQTVWGNFRKQLERKKISESQPINITEEVLKRINLLEQKKTKKKKTALQNVIEQQKKNILPSSTFLPPIELETQRVDNQLPEEYLQQTDEFVNLSKQDRNKLVELEFDCEDIITQFELLSERKVRKYRKIISSKLQWFEKKIVQKCLQKKRFKKLLVPNHLSTFYEKGNIAKELSIRKLQMYVKQITYWIEDNSNVLSDYMKDKFIDNCKSLRKCIIRVIKYRKIHKYRTNFGVCGEQGLPQILEAPENPLENQREFDNFENKMKEFKRMLERDSGESNKKDTKIILKNENGVMQVFDWTSDKKPERNVSKREGVGFSSKPEVQDIDEKRKNEEKKREEIKRDEEFLDEYSKKSNVLLIAKYKDSLRIEWEQTLARAAEVAEELPKDLCLNFTDDDF